MAIKSSDQISIVDLTDGYSVILTNDSFTFPGSTTAAVAGSTTTTIVAMCGGTQVPATVDNAEIVSPSGVTTSVDTDPTQPTVTITVSGSVTSGGTVDIPVSLDNGNIVIHKMFTFQISFRGQTGYSAQWYSGTGVMESEDIAYGITGFLVMFFIFAIIRGIYHGIRELTKKDERREEELARHYDQSGRGY